MDGILITVHPRSLFHFATTPWLPAVSRQARLLLQFAIRPLSRLVTELNAAAGSRARRAQVDRGPVGALVTVELTVTSSLLGRAGDGAISDSEFKLIAEVQFVGRRGGQAGTRRRCLQLVKPAAVEQSTGHV